MGLIIRYCACGEILSTEDVKEGRPCKKCRKKKGLKIPLLHKVVKTSNPAPNLWLQKHQEEKTNG